ncbi:MAG: universal stress protein [Bacteroidia bacterium]
MSQTILVPTDFSKNAAHALNYAIDVAKHRNAKLILLHAYNIDFAASYVPVNLIESEIQQAKEKSNVQLKGLQTKVAHAGHINCECISRQDNAIEAILSVIKEKDVDLVIMGTQGASGISGLFFGSNTAAVVEKATCPVMAIPDDTRINKLRKITYASNYHHSDIAIISEITGLAKAYGAQINILHISPDKEFAGEEKHKMEEFIAEVEKKVNYNNLSFQLLYGADPEEKLAEYLQDDTTDLLVISTQHRSFYEKIVERSITKRLVQYVKIPILAFHNKKAETITIY